MASWLQYGVDSDGGLVGIHAVRRGKTALVCPYCSGGLTARKGDIKTHHFAHSGETCRQVADSTRELPLLPLYDKFNLHLSPKEFEAFQKGCRRGYWEPADMRDRFEQKGLIGWNAYKGRTGGDELTNLGKIPIGELSLMLFNKEQEFEIRFRLKQLERKVEQAWISKVPNWHDYLADLKIYRAQLRRILSTTLYYLEIQADGQTFYKVGVTTRAIDERTPEIEAELRSHFQSVALKVLGTWEHRGNVELYFKYRYEPFQCGIGSLTEYFQFDDVADAKAALRDLRRMKPKELNEAELDIVAGKPSAIEQMIMAEQRAQQRSQAICTGMNRAKYWGTHVGRPKGGESNEVFLSKPSSQRVIAALNEGMSVRKAAAAAGVAVNTVRKVKALIEQSC